MLKKIGVIALTILIVNQILLNFTNVFAEEKPPSIPLPLKTLTSLSSLYGPFNQLLDTNGDAIPDFLFRFPTQKVQINFVHSNQKAYTLMEEKEWIYNVTEEDFVVGELRFVLKQIDSRELAYFLRYTPRKETKEPIVVELNQFGESSLSGRTPVSEIGESKLPYDWAEFAIGEKPVELPMGSLYLEGEEIAYRVGTVDTFRDLGYSVRDQLVKDQYPSTATLSGQSRIFNFKFSGKLNSYSETWGILGDKSLFDWEQTSFATHMLREDISINKKLSMEGLFYRLPSNYKPYSTNGFYLNPANVLVLRTLWIMGSNGPNGRFLDDLTIMLGHMSVENQNEEGFWPTQPKSEWLEQDYKIGYNYYDNRRNADNATFLLELYKQYPEKRLKEALEKHVQFLYRMIEDRSVHTSEWGLLFSDYTGFPNGEKSHIALNHHLAVINFLLKWELLTGDDTAKYYSRRMIIGVEDTTALWIKEDKNLYYALYADLTPHPYPDYLSLTLSDLKETQYLLQKIGKVNASIQHLIDHKSEWVANQSNQN